MFVVTGGGSGLGCALAYALSQRGHNVLIVGRRESALFEVASFSPKITMLCADISSDEGCRKIADHLSGLVSIKGLIHNAALIEPITPISSMDRLSWQQMMATNLDAPLFLTQMLLDKLKGGRVLHVGTAAADFPLFGWSGYCVSKAALAMLTCCWQLEGQTLSDLPAFASVKPGIIDTDMQAVIRGAASMDMEARDFFIGLQENSRLLLPETVAGFITWLLLDVTTDEYISSVWDIYDTSHHKSWLLPNQVVPHWE